MKIDIKSLILYEDASIIVCHKPAGIATQSSRIGTQDMVSLLKNYLAGCTQNFSRHPYLAVIHRLDQPVEGIMVFARTPQAAANLNRQLTSSGFGKYYRAITAHAPIPAEGILENYIVKDGRTNFSRICSKNTPGAKYARLTYKTKETYPDGSALVLIHLDTGRHHQIRVQMAHLGCPLAGDRKYGNTVPTGSLKLCAYRLEFLHPADGRPMKFELPM